MVYLKYLWYVIRHKWYVMLECWKQGLYWTGVKHDWSKFLLSEFIPYARYFYGNYPSIKDIHGDQRNHIHTYKEDIEREFNMAWLLHQKRNGHHWQWYILAEDTVVVFEYSDINIFIRREWPMKREYKLTHKS